MARSLSPNFERRPSLDDIVEKYGSAKEAFERGNYYVSLIKAQKEDNSHIQASDSIGALICFGNERFVKKRYRKFNIRNENVQNDDYGMMKEVLFRRFSKAIKEKSGSLSLPELILIDGGKGQYSVSREVLNELGLHDLPILAVA